MKQLLEVLAPRYSAQDAQLGPISGSCEVWRILAALSMIIALTFVGSNLYFDFSSILVPAEGTPQDGDTPTAMLLLLFSFSIASIAVLITVRVFHNWPIDRLFGPLAQGIHQFRNTLIGLIAVGVLLLVLPPYGSDTPLRPNLEFGTWLVLLPLALIAVLVQVEAEELLFRGYLQQALATRFRQKWVWIGIPSLIFAFGHYLPQDAGENAILIAIWAGCFGVLMADLTARAGSLGPAIAVHFANNVVALLIVGSPTSLNGLALYLMPFELNDSAAIRPWLWVDFAMMLVSWLVARLAIRA